MRGLAIMLAVVAVAAALSSAGATPAPIYHAARAHFLEMYQPDGHPYEVRVFAGTQEVYASTEEGGEEEGEGGPGGCVEIFHANTIDFGCGSLTIQYDPVLERSVLTGTLSSYAYAYDPETIEFIDLGESTIEVNLVLTGSGDITVAHSERSHIGLCGLPPNNRGAWVWRELPLRRAAAPAGTLTSAVIGAVDAAPLVTTLYDISVAAAGACVDEKL